MFSPDERLAEEVARQTDRLAPAHLFDSRELSRWARNYYHAGPLLVDEEGKSVPLSSLQIARAADLAATWRQQRAGGAPESKSTG